MLGEFFRKALGVEDAELLREFNHAWDLCHQSKNLGEFKKASAAMYKMAQTRHDKAGYRVAQEYVADWYFGSGFGAFGWEINLEEAVRWSREAARQKSGKSCSNLSLCYFYGIFVERNYVEAIRWMILAQEFSKHGCYMHNLHVMLYGCQFENTSDVPRDLLKRAERMVSGYSRDMNEARLELPNWCHAELYKRGLSRDDFYNKIIERVER